MGDDKPTFEIELLDEDGQPMANQPYRLTNDDGKLVKEGALDQDGRAVIDDVDADHVHVEFPGVDDVQWFSAY